MPIRFKIFQFGGLFSSAEYCLRNASEQAAAFADSLDPEQLINVSQAFPHPNAAVVTVWYRTEDLVPPPGDKPQANDSPG